MRLVGETLLGAYEGKIINIHPSLLPAFKGKDAIQQAFEYGVKVYGCTIHYVDSSLDGGKIIAQSAVAYDGNDIEELEQKIHSAEHTLYINTIRELLN
jgi:phosphoribosylglycinamide formyltransferase-1